MSLEFKHGLLDSWCDQIQRTYLLFDRAPHDCNMYITGVAGTFQSFGWSGTAQIGAQHYTYCVRRELGNHYHQKFDENFSKLSFWM